MFHFCSVDSAPTGPVVMVLVGVGVPLRHLAVIYILQNSATSLTPRSSDSETQNKLHNCCLSLDTIIFNHFSRISCNRKQKALNPPVPLCSVVNRYSKKFHLKVDTSAIRVTSG